MRNYQANLVTIYLPVDTRKIFKTNIYRKIFFHLKRIGIKISSEIYYFSTENT